MMSKTSTDCKTVARLCSDIARLGDNLVTEQSARRHSATADHHNENNDIGTKTGQGNMLQVPGENSIEKRRSKSVSEIESEKSSTDMDTQDTSRARSGSASKRQSPFGFHRSRSGSRKASRKRKGSTASRTSGIHMASIG